MRLLIFCILILPGAAAFSQSGTDDIATLKKLNEDWIHSYPGKDTATLSRILADDLIMITPNGSRIGKAAMLKNVSSPGQQIKTADVSTAEVRLLGNTALVIAEAKFITLDNGKEVPGRTSYLDVYEKRQGRWIAIAAHVTFLGQ